MPLWDNLDAGRTAPTGVLATIERLLSAGTVTSVHYSGYAHESVLRLLHRHLGTAFTVMDYPDRYSTGAEFFWEGEGECPGPGRPDWLEGVAFYQEGIPDADLLIFDVPWSAPDQLAAILKRRRPKHLLLADEACSGASHPDYSWAIFPRHAHGTLNSDNRWLAGLILQAPRPHWQRRHPRHREEWRPQTLRAPPSATRSFARSPREARKPAITLHHRTYRARAACRP